MQEIILHTVNVDIFAQLNFHAYSPMWQFRVDKFLRTSVNSLCSIMMYFSLTSYFRASKSLREMRENMYCAKMSTFTVFSPILDYFIFSEWFGSSSGDVRQHGPGPRLVSSQPRPQRYVQEGGTQRYVQEGGTR